MASNRISLVTGQLFNAGLLHNEVCIVTGGAQGVGRATCLLFANEGAKVVVADLDLKKALAVVAEIHAAGGQAIAVGGDITAQDYPKRLIDATVQAFGGINHIVNNAGFTFDKMLHNMTDETFELMLKVHNTAPFRIIREAAPYLRLKTPEGLKANKSIVNISSTSGIHGNTGQANYAVAKSGINGLTKTVAKEWGPFNVRCNSIAFGYIATRLTQAKELGETISIGGQAISLGVPGAGNRAPGDTSVAPVQFSNTPLRRGGSPHEAAKSVLFLCSPLASYITGHVLEVTGGVGI